LSPPRKNQNPPDYPRKINDFCLKRGTDPSWKTISGFRVLVPSQKKYLADQSDSSESDESEDDVSDSGDISREYSIPMMSIAYQ